MPGKGRKPMEENKISDLFATTLESVKGVVDANTVMGAPVTTPNGVTIIPVSKVSVGFAGGGTDFGSKKDPAAKKNFGGGGGTGVTTSPVGFIIIDACGSVKFINVNNPSNESMTVAELTEKIPPIIAKIKEMLEKKKEEKAEKTASKEKEEKTVSE